MINKEGLYEKIASSKRGRKLGVKQGSLLLKQGVVKQTHNHLLKVFLFLKKIITL